MRPEFLSLAEVLQIHYDQITRYGGSPGVRDREALESAVAMPAAGAGDHYVHPDLAAMAAAYLFHIVQTHPFVDGNKRVGAVAAIVFLAMNGNALMADEDELGDLVLEVAQGRAGKDAAAQFIRDHSKPV